MGCIYRRTGWHLSIRCLTSSLFCPFLEKGLVCEGVNHHKCQGEDFTLVHLHLRLLHRDPLDFGKDFNNAVSRSVTRQCCEKSLLCSKFHSPWHEDSVVYTVPNMWAVWSEVWKQLTWRLCCVWFLICELCDPRSENSWREDCVVSDS